MKYIIRNDVTHSSRFADAAEARLYALGGPLDTWYTVLKVGGSGIGLLVCEVQP